MIGSSIVSTTTRKTGAASLTDLLFPNTITLYESGDMATLVPPAGSEVLCPHCHKKSFTMIGDCIVVVQRHDGQYHKTVMPIGDLGLMRIPL